MLVGLFVMAFLGLGGAGGYWYFVMDAVWPLPFVEALLARGGEDLPILPDDSLGSQVPESLLVATGDSGPTDDSAAVAEDTAPPPPPLPPTGVLVLTNVSSRARVSLDGEAMQGTTYVLEPRSYTIRVTRSGYQDFETSTSVARGDTVRLRVTQTRIQPVEPPPPVAQCTDPRSGDTYNLNSACFDQAPRPTGVPVIPLPEGVQGSPRAILWVKVLADSSVGQMDWHTRSGNLAFDLAAQAFARRRMTYRPAVKNGQPVDAWLRLPIQGRPR
jgi:hypothetical protein